MPIAFFDTLRYSSNPGYQLSSGNRIDRVKLRDRFTVPRNHELLAAFDSVDELAEARLRLGNSELRRATECRTYRALKYRNPCGRRRLRDLLPITVT
jgi:hypothetical protein